jgi:hypothetical protein
MRSLRNGEFERERSQTLRVVMRGSIKGAKTPYTCELKCSWLANVCIR